MKFKSSNRAEGKKLEQRKVLLLLTGAKKILKNKNNNSFNETRFQTTFQPYFHVLKIVCVLELEWKMDSLQSSNFKRQHVSSLNRLIKFFETNDYGMQFLDWMENNACE